MKTLTGTLKPILDQDYQRPPTLWELKEKYPWLILRVEADPRLPWNAVALVHIPYGGDTLRLMRSIKGVTWEPKEKTWHVPARSSRRLAEVLHVAATRSL
jgi:hypothetical protein